VVGCGMIGVLVIQSLRAAGCGSIVAIDTDERRLKMAAEAGATETRTSGDGVAGADLAIECVGATEPIRTAIASVRKGGAVTLVGNVAPEIQLPLQAVVSRQSRLQGSCASNGEYPVAIDLMSRGVIRVESLISAVAPLREGAEWFGKLYRREANLMKVILQP